MKKAVARLGVMLSIVCCASLAWAETLDEFARRLAAATLDFDRATDARGIELPFDYGRLRMESGVIVPVVLADDGRTFELVFVGRGRLVMQAPDAIEARQLRSFAGEERIDAPIRSAVVIVGDPGLAERLAGGAPAEVEPATRAVAAEEFEAWVSEAERKGFGARTALLRAMADDPSGKDYLGVWFVSRRLGRGFLAVDPHREEPVTLGSYRLYDRDDFETRSWKKWERKAEKAQRRTDRKLGRTADGPEDDDEEPDGECGAAIRDARQQAAHDSREESIRSVLTWVSAARAGTATDSDRAGIEPQHYRIELDLRGDDLDARGTARIELRSEVDGQRVATLGLGSSLEVCEVRGAEGEVLSFTRVGWDLLVLLPRPTVRGERFELVVDFAGKPIDHWLGRRRLRHTVVWHPHAGQLDRATYDVTLRWPEELTLLASGRSVEEGVEDGVRRTRRVLDVPSKGFSFEVGELDAVEDRVGHLDLTFGFHRDDPELTEEIRQEIIRTVKASLLFFETQLGLLPIERLTVVIAKRGFSQGLLGFVTLAEGAVHGLPPALLDNRTSQEVRLETIAHEISHQWWGHVVGWDSYRDQWLSEGLADFSSLRFMEQIATRPEAYGRKHAAAWRHALRKTTWDGQPLGSLGPVVLGRRLRQNHGSTAYHSIVYEKGAAVFSTLAQRLGTEETWQMLGALTKAVNNRVIRTSTFFHALEKMSGLELEPFVRQYVYGTGMPTFFCEHRVRRDDGAGWLVEGTVRQLPAPRFRFVLRRDGSGWDVVKRVAQTGDGFDWTNVVPFRVEMASAEAAGGGRAMRGTLTVRGEISRFAIPTADRPIGFELDPTGRVLADVQLERSRPREFLCLLGEHLTALGRFEEAGRALDQAMEVETAIAGQGAEELHEQEVRELNARIRLARARLLLDQDLADEARRELVAAEKMLTARSSFYAGERAVLQARLELKRGRFNLARLALIDYLQQYGVDLDSYRQELLLDRSQRSELKIARGEVLGLLAVAARETGEVDSEILVRLAGLAGVDLRALDAPRDGRAGG